MNYINKRVISRFFQSLRGVVVILMMAQLFLTSCLKDPQPPDPHDIHEEGKGVYVLNEGLFHMNNSTLTRYDFETETAHTDFFEMRNGRKLGDTGNDMKRYGGKIYIVVNISSQVEVLDAHTGVSLGQIPLFDGDKARQPRNIAFLHDKAFICSFDGTVAVIDTTSLEVEKYIKVGRNPDGITTANNKVYVANSGGLDFPNYDNTVSVIDFDLMEETHRIEVGPNPYTMEADEQGFVYLISRGNYEEQQMYLQIIDTATDQLVHTFTGFQALSFSIGDGAAYVYHYDYTGGTGSSILVFDLESREVIRQDFITDGTEIQTVYGIYADKTSGDVFITDAKGFVTRGRVYCFDSEGHKKYSFPAGLNPSSICIY